MDDDRARKIGALALRAGEIQIANAMAVADVIDSLHRICAGFGLQGVSVVVEIGSVTVSYLAPDLSGSGTMVRVVHVGEPHVERLIEVQRLVDRIESGDVDLEAAWDALDAIETSPERYGAITRLLASVLSVAAWAVFAGGDAFSMVTAMVAAFGVHLAQLGTARARVPEVFGTIVGTVIVVLVPYGAAWAGVDFRVSAAVVGGLYPLLPGARLVASVADGISGAVQASVARGLQAIVTAVAVAVGVLAGLTIVDAVGVELPDVQTGPWPVAVTAVAAALGVALLAVARRVPLRYVTAVGVLAGAVWIVSRVGSDNELGANVAVGVAAVVLGLAGRLLARAQHSVATLYTTLAVLVLVPGTTLYLAMLSFARQANDAGVTFTAEALTTSLAIAVGTSIGIAVGGSVPPPPARLRLPGRRR